MICLFVGMIWLDGCTRQDSRALTVYSAGPRSLAESVCRDFEAKTGVPTRLFCATTGEIMAKLQAEEFRPQADVVILAGQTAAEVLKEEDMLAPLPAGDYLKLNPAWNDPEGYYAATSACALGIALRRDRYNPALEWEEVFNGALAGNLIMPSPSQSGSSAEFVTNFQLLAPERFWNGMVRAKRRGLQISGPNNQALTSLVLGAHDAVIGAADYLVFKQMERGEPVAMHFPASGCPLSLRPIAILARSPRQADAAVFVKFWFSKDAQQRIAAEHLLPVDPSVELSAMRRAIPPVRPLLGDVRAARREQADLLRRFRYEIESGVAAR